MAKPTMTHATKKYLGQLGRLSSLFRVFAERIITIKLI